MIIIAESTHVRETNEPSIKAGKWELIFLMLTVVRREEKQPKIIKDRK